MENSTITHNDTTMTISIPQSPQEGVWGSAWTTAY